MPDQAAFISEGERALTNRWIDKAVDALKGRLLKAGWASGFGVRVLEMERFAKLIPAPDATFTVRNVVTGEQCPVAVYVAECGDDVSYACTILLAEGKVVDERGRLHKTTGEFVVVEAHGSLDDPPPTSSQVDVVASPKHERSATVVRATRGTRRRDGSMAVPRARRALRAGPREASGRNESSDQEQRTPER